MLSDSEEKPAEKGGAKEVSKKESSYQPSEEKEMMYEPPIKKVVRKQ